MTTLGGILLVVGALIFDGWLIWKEVRSSRMRKKERAQL